MRSAELLFERYINLFTNADKMQYGQEVWDLLQKAYADKGGFKSAPDIEALVSDSGMWKLSRRGGKINAALIYKDMHGRKMIGLATDGTRRGIADYANTLATDMSMKRAWAEVSGKPEAYLIRLGAKPIPAKYAPMLTGKSIIEFNPDGIHYTRLLSGEPHEKALYGFVKLTPELIQILKSSHIDLAELPDNFNL